MATIDQIIDSLRKLSTKDLWLVSTLVDELLKRSSKRAYPLLAAENAELDMAHYLSQFSEYEDWLVRGDVLAREWNRPEEDAARSDL